MSNRNGARSSSFLGGALLLAAACSMGCGGLSAGDYVIYRVAFGEQSSSDGCYYPNDGPDPNTRNDSNTFLAAETFVLYAGVEDTFYLEATGVALEGTADGDVYSFGGKDVDVEYQNADGTGYKFTTTTSTTVEMTMDGASVSGTSSTKLSQSCKGTGCPDLPPSCTQSRDFIGTEVEDLELEHAVD